MGLMVVLLIVFFAGVTIFILIEKPFIIAALVIFLYLYNLNIPTPLPLDFRGILLIMLFARIFIFDKENLHLVLKYLLTEKYSQFVIVFLLLSLFVTLFYPVKLLPQIRSFILSIISVILGFISTSNKKGEKVFVYSIIIAAIISTADIIYSFAWMGSIHVTRLVDYLILPEPGVINFDYPGLLCGLGFIYTYLFFIRKKMNKFVAFPLMILQGLGVLVSTSRSTLLAMIVIIILIVFFQKEIKFNPKKILNFALAGILFFICFYFLYSIILHSENVEQSLFDQIYWRLIEEPSKLFGDDVKQFDELSGKEIQGTMTWRYLKALDDIQKFENQSFDIEIFGLGVEGYMRTKFGGDYYNAHNGYVLILIERGILGLGLFLIFSVGLSIKSLKYTKQYSVYTPVVYLFIMLLVYGVAQNSEITSPLGFLLVGGMIGNFVNYEEFEENKEEEVEDFKEINKSFSSSYSK